MDGPMPTETKPGAPFEIDYDHVNVAEIMARIQKAAAEAPLAEAWEETAPRDPAQAASAPSPQASMPAPPAPGGTDWSPEPRGLKPKLKRILRKIMRPFFPVMRLLAFPVHEELRAAVKSLHDTNVRLDNLYRLLHLQAEKFERDLEIERTRLEIEQKRTDRGEHRLDLVEERLKDLDTSMAYIRLLHNLDHNLVVELTKLKIETDTLKSKFRILEKDQEFLQNREKALEERSSK